MAEDLQRKADVEVLFSPELWERMSKYIPNVIDPHKAKILSGRMLEENLELHLASGGTPQTAIMHVMDAIANEAFKVKKQIDKNDGYSQYAYPSNFLGCYNRKEVLSEIADNFFLLITNMIVSDITPSEVLEMLLTKLAKLEKAKEDGNLHVTSSGCFYIKKEVENDVTSQTSQIGSQS